MRKIFTLALVSTLLLSISCRDNEKLLPDCTGAVWGYRGTDGPGFWKDICQNYGDCGGEAQSPVNIEGEVDDNSLEPLAIRSADSEIHALNNGLTVAFTMDPGSELTFNGVTYQLEQFHFHTPGEHTVDGFSYPVEVHFDYKSPQSGQLAVVSMFVREGAINPFLTQIVPQLPSSGQEYHDPAFINPGAFLPANLSYHTYTGSLSTPPCTENVIWIILENPVEASANQIGAFVSKQGRNNRPLQQLNGRVIRHFHQ